MFFFASGFELEWALGSRQGSRVWGLVGQGRVCVSFIEPGACQFSCSSSSAHDVGHDAVATTVVPSVPRVHVRQHNPADQQTGSTSPRRVGSDVSA